MKKYLTIVHDDFSETQVEEPVSEHGFTYADYLKWNFKERIELIRGQIFKMSPAPNIEHQKISLNIVSALNKYLENKNCHLFYAPVDVRLKGKNNIRRMIKDEEITTVVQPDIIVVCDEEKLRDKRSVNGAPDLVIEILSPGNTTKEMQLKYELYEENEVKEYWIVYPEYKQIAVFTLNNQLVYDKPHFYVDKTVNSVLFPQLKIFLKDIFNL